VSLFIALFGLGQQFLHFPVITTTNSEFSKGLALSLGAGARINSTFAGHYDFAAFLLFPLLLCLALLPVSRPKWPVIIIGALSYWVMLLSASRITFASFFLSAVLLLVIINKKLWLIPLGIITFLGIMLSPQLRGRYGELFVNHIRLSLISSVSAQEISRDVNAVPDALKPPVMPEDRSFNIRLKAEWPKALRAFYLNPFFGSGFSSIGLAADNDYLRTLAETGILGLLAFLLIFVRFFKTISPRFLHYLPGPENAFMAFVICAVMGLLLNALFIDIFAASKIAIITWLFIGMTVKAYEKTS
jgi:O-antigen ligase